MQDTKDKGYLTTNQNTNDLDRDSITGTKAQNGKDRIIICLNYLFGFLTLCINVEINSSQMASYQLMKKTLSIMSFVCKLRKNLYLTV